MEPAQARLRSDESNPTSAERGADKKTSTWFELLRKGEKPGRVRPGTGGNGSGHPEPKASRKLAAQEKLFNDRNGPGPEDQDADAAAPRCARDREDVGGPRCTRLTTRSAMLVQLRDREGMEKPTRTESTRRVAGPGHTKPQRSTKSSDLAERRRASGLPGLSVPEADTKRPVRPRLCKSMRDSEPAKLATGKKKTGPSLARPETDTISPGRDMLRREGAGSR